MLLLAIALAGCIDPGFLINDIKHPFARSECSALTAERSVAYLGAWVRQANQLLENNPTLTARELLNATAPSVTGFWQEVQGLNMEQAVRKALKQAETVQVRTAFLAPKKAEAITNTKDIIKQISLWLESHPESPVPETLKQDLKNATQIHKDMFHYCGKLFG